jgi:hypothetical protein
VAGNDDALNAYQAERVENAKLANDAKPRDRRSTLGPLWRRDRHLDRRARRATRLSSGRRESWDSDARLGTRYVAVNKAIGNVPGEQAKTASN